MAVEMQDVRHTVPQVDAGRTSRGRPGRGRRSDDPYVYPAALRFAGWAAIVGVTAAVAWLARSVHGEKPYLIAWVLAGAVFGFPGLVLAWWSGSHVDESDRPMWRLWFVGFAATAVGAVSLVAFSGV